MSTATKATSGFALSCPGCHEDGSVTINLNDLSEGVICHSCDETFDPAEIAADLTAQAKRWAAVARLVETAMEMAAGVSEG